MKTAKTYDFAFFVGGLPYTSYPSGGENVIFQLCYRLKLQGYKVALIVIKNWQGYLYKIKGDKKILKVTARKHPYIRRVLSTEIFNTLGGEVLRKLNHIDYDFTILNNIDIYFLKSPNTVQNIHVKRAIAAGWGTADFTGEFVSKNSAEGYYLVQNSEDDHSFSGALNNYAADTYKLKNLKKIVINHGMYKRFENEKPLLFNVGIDYTLFNKQSNGKENIILFPLRGSESKGAKYVLEAAENLHKELSGWKFSAFGDYTLSIPDYIDFHPRVNTNELINLYEKSAVFILPSLVEGFSLTVLEAMASGCAVISTDCGGVDEYGINNKNILFVPIKNSKAIESAALNLIKDEQLLKKLSANAIITAEKYSYENMYKGFISIFK